MRKNKHIQIKKSYSMCDGCNECSNSCCLKIENLSVKLEDDTILDNVNFHLHCGELVALIGPNGAGKSSLFKTILGQMPFEGKITFQTAQGNKFKPRIGYVPQSPNFDKGDPVSVLDLFVCSISNYPVWLPVPKKLRQQIYECLERVKGESLIDKRIGSLSGGELQRILLAMALEPVPQILILDEPFSGVDMEGERQLFELLDDIRNRFDLSIMICTHDFNTLSIMDKVILLKKKVLKVGTPEEVVNSSEFKRLFSIKTETKAEKAETEGV